MKINKETKVGILAVVAIALLIFGFNFLKGNQVFSKSKNIYAVFDKLGSLDKSNSVKINGLPIGTVYDFAPVDKEVSAIVVTIHLTKDVNIPRDSKAFITAGLVGSSSITIAMGSSNDYLQPGDTITTIIDEGILGDLTSQVNPTLTKARDAIDSMKIMIGNVNSILDPNTQQNMQALIANLARSSAQIQALLSAQSSVLAQSLQHVNTITGTLANNTGRIDNTMANLEATSANLAKINIQGTLDTLDQTVNNLKHFSNKLNTSEGSLGALMNDKTLYENLNYTIIGLETLIDDIRVNPKRYVNISVFGGRNKGGPITSPEIKDTVIRLNQ